MLKLCVSGLEVREVLDEPSSSAPIVVINFVVPVSGRREALERFLDNYERVCCLNSTNIIQCKLLIVHHPSGIEEDDTLARKSILHLSQKYGKENIKILEDVSYSKFSRARALDAGAQEFKADDLLFFVDVDMSFTLAALERIARNTRKSRSLYFPVVYSQYDPKVTLNKQTSKIDDNSGFWRIFGYGIAAMYKSDYAKIGGFDLQIEGWGKEDVDLYEKILKYEDLGIFRAPDVDLVHVYHGVSCDSLEKETKGDQLSMCKGTRADTYASTQLLANIVLRNPSKYLSFGSNRTNSAAAA